MRGAFCSGQVTRAMAACTAAVGAATTAAQSGNRSRSALNAAPLSALRVRWDSRELTSSLSGSSAWK